MGFAAGFRVGFDSVSEGMKERERKEMLKGVRGVLDDKPVQSQGYTAEQGQDLEAAAARGDKIDIAYKEDGKGNKVFDRYVVTAGPGTAVSDPSVVSRDVATQGVTDFLGNRTAGTLTEPQMQTMRTKALAGVVGRYDPIKGIEITRQAAIDEQNQQRQDKLDARQAVQDEQNAERFAWEKGAQKRKEDDLAKNDQYEEDRKRILASGNVARVNQQNAQAMEVFNREQAAYLAAAKSGDGNQSRLTTPARPVMAVVTPGQRMQDYANLIALEAANGKLTTAGMMSFDKALQELEKEGYVKAMRLAQSGASIDRVLQTYNSQGNDRREIGDVASDSMVTGPNGVPARVITFKDGLVINALAELDAVGQAQSAYDQFYKREDNKRADRSDQRGEDANRRGERQVVLAENADRRATAAAAQSAADASRARQDTLAKQNAAVVYFKEQNPNATAAQLEAVRRGVIAAVPKDDGYKVEMGDVASAFGVPAVGPDGKPVVDVMTGRQVVNRNVDEENKFFQWMQDNGIRDTNKGLALYKGQRPSGPKPLKDVTDADIKATAKKYNISEDEVRKRLNLK